MGLSHEEQRGLLREKEMQVAGEEQEIEDQGRVLHPKPTPSPSTLTINPHDKLSP